MNTINLLVLIPASIFHTFMLLVSCHIATKLWIKAYPLGAQILPREGHSAVLMNAHEMYVFGGISYGHLPFNEVWVYNAGKDEFHVLG